MHVNQLRQWHDALVAHAGDVIASDEPAVRDLQAAAHAREKTELYAEIHAPASWTGVGQLTTQVNWLKKFGILLSR